MKRAVALLSGGLDSTVALAMARRTFEIILALNFDYSQRAAKKEDELSRAISDYYHINYKSIKLKWLGEITLTSLVRKEKKLPHISIGDLDKKEFLSKTMKAVWIPNRNGLFVNIAASLAEAIDCKYIITGFDLEEAGSFPDNSLDFIKAENRALAFSTLNKVKVISPLCKMDKMRIIKVGQELGVPFQFIWSCYEGGNIPCKKCESCQRVRRAIRKIGILPGDEGVGILAKRYL